VELFYSATEEQIIAAHRFLTGYDYLFARYPLACQVSNKL